MEPSLEKVISSSLEDAVYAQFRLSQLSGEHGRSRTFVAFFVLVVVLAIFFLPTIYGAPVGFRAVLSGVAGLLYAAFAFGRTTTSIVVGSGAS